MTIMEKDLTNNEKDPLTNTFGQKPKLKPKYAVHRDVLTQEIVIQKTGYEARDKSVIFGVRQYWSHWSFFALFQGVLPILSWLPKYSIKNYLIGDTIAGVTVAVMHIPQGMAYGILAGVSAGVGLYMAFFPVLVYMLFGTSKHISMGTFAVVSMMTLKVVQTYATVEHGAPEPPDGEGYTPMQVVTATAFMVGIIHLIMGFLRLGTLATLLSEPLVNGFTTAAAVHVVTSQLKDILGVSIPRHKGAFKIVYTLVDLGKSIPDTNLGALTFSAGVIVFMVLMNELLKPWLSKKCRFPLPAELLAVIGGTLIARFFDVNAKYGIVFVGDIAVGLPGPKLPTWSLLPMVAVDAIAIAIVSYSIVMSMGLIFAKKHSYEISANQELFAMGLSNMVGGCFSCIPLACSLSRSVIQDQTGGVTQIASFVSAGLILIVLLWIGPFFSTLPRCVLAGVIIVALKGMFMQAKELKKFSQQGKLELLTWVATFLGVVFIDIDLGLLIGIGVSLMTLYVKGLKPYSCMLGIISPKDAVYVDLKRHKSAKEVHRTKIYRYFGSLNFATKSAYKKSLYELIELNPQKIRRISISAENGADLNLLNSFRSLILDFSTLGHLDVAGYRTLSDIKKEMRILGVRMFIACPSDRVYDTLMHSVALGEDSFEIFPSLHDAVVYSNACCIA